MLVKALLLAIKDLLGEFSLPSHVPPCTPHSPPNASAHPPKSHVLKLRFLFLDLDVFGFSQEVSLWCHGAPKAPLGRREAPSVGALSAEGAQRLGSQVIAKDVGAVHVLNKARLMQNRVDGNNPQGSGMNPK